MTARKPVHSRRPPIWIATSDGIAHARARGRSPRTACGAIAFDERYGWPEKARCATCMAVIAKVEATA